MKASVYFSRRRVFATVLILLFCATARGQFVTVAQDSFNYTNNNASLSGQNGGSGWTGAWTNTYTPGASFLVSTNGLPYPGVTNSGGSMVWGSGGNGISEDFRALPRQSSGVVYVQFVSHFASSSGGGTPNIRLLDSGTLTGGFGGNGGTYGAFVSILDTNLNAATNGSSSSSVSLGLTNLVVGRIDYGSNITKMWVNPDLSTFNYANPTNVPNATYAGLAPKFNGIDVVSRSPANVDEITILAMPGQTPAPVLSSPVANSGYGGAGISISYTLPVTPLAGSVQLTFTNSQQSLVLTLTNATNVSFVLSPHSPLASPNVVSSTPPSGALPDGTYTVLLSYQDASGDPAAVTGTTNILVDTITLPPVLLAPQSGTAITSTGLHLSYQLPEAPAAGSVAISFQNSNASVVLFLNASRSNDFVVSPTSLTSAAAVTSATSSALPDGRYAVSLSYQDALFNPAATVQASNVLVVLETLQFYPTNLAYSNGLFQLGFTNNLASGLGFNYDLMTSSNVTTPLSNWVDLGPVTESPPGHFQFQEMRTNSPTEFYLLRVR